MLNSPLMKALTPHVLICIFSLVFSQQDTWYSPSATNWNSILHQMKFRQPVLFTPFEVKIGYLNYGSGNYWTSSPYNSNPILISDLPILLDSTQYNFDIHLLHELKYILIELNNIIGCMLILGGILLSQLAPIYKKNYK
mgnify:CR=1 FL=1